MKRLIATGMAGAVLAGVMSAGVAQAKPVFTSLIGGKIQQVRQSATFAIPTTLTIAHKKANGKHVFHGDVKTTDVAGAPVDQVGCAEAREIHLLKWTQTAGAKTRRTRDDKFEWKMVKRGFSDEFGEWQIKLDTANGKYQAEASKDSFTAEYGDLITCKVASSREISV